MFRMKIESGLELRLLEEWHAEAVFAAVDRNREHLRHWLPWLDEIVSSNDTRSFIKKSLNGYAAGEKLVAGIWDHDQAIGSISYNFIDQINRFARIGYWLAADYQGKGIMTNACRAMVDYAFDELGLNRVEIRCAPGNLKSRSIPERLGFKQEGVQRETEWLYDHFIDLVLYAMLAIEWPAAKRGKN